jgi:hypothetical protein
VAYSEGFEPALVHHQPLLPRSCHVLQIADMVSVCGLLEFGTILVATWGVFVVGVSLSRFVVSVGAIGAHYWHEQVSNCTESLAFDECEYCLEFAWSSKRSVQTVAVTVSGLS